ncbi:hypothetical protein L208DRAFT_1070083, partial [Tricholoma matsutake]
QSPKESDILPANVALNDRIKMLRERWLCNMSTCHSDHCFVPADRSHFPLGHEHFEKWAAAWLWSEHSANIDMPLHISLFDPIAPQTLTTKSPLLQAHLNAMANKGQPGSAAPIINCNVVMPNNMFGFLHPTPAPASLPAPPLAVPQPHAASLQVLISPNLQPSIKQDIVAFCHTYGLSDEVL